MKTPFLHWLRAAVPCGVGLALLSGCGSEPMTPPSSGHNPGVTQAAPPSSNPPGTATFPPLPGNNMTDMGPERSYSDIVTKVEEVPSGTLTFGTKAVPYRSLKDPAMQAVDRAADRADAAIDRADAAVDTAIRRTDATMDRAMDRTDRTIDQGLGRANMALKRVDETARRVGGVLKAVEQALEPKAPPSR
jgi:hypothetical protein